MILSREDCGVPSPVASRRSPPSEPTSVGRPHTPNTATHRPAAATPSASPARPARDRPHSTRLNHFHPRPASPQRPPHPHQPPVQHQPPPTSSPEAVHTPARPRTSLTFRSGPDPHPDRTPQPPASVPSPPPRPPLPPHPEPLPYVVDLPPMNKHTARANTPRHRDAHLSSEFNAPHTGSPDRFRSSREWTARGPSARNSLRPPCSRHRSGRSSAFGIYRRIQVAPARHAGPEKGFAIHGSHVFLSPSMAPPGRPSRLSNANRMGKPNLGLKTLRASCPALWPALVRRGPSRLRLCSGPLAPGILPCARGGIHAAPPVLPSRHPCRDLRSLSSIQLNDRCQHHWGSVRVVRAVQGNSMGPLTTLTLPQSC